MKTQRFCIFCGGVVDNRTRRKGHRIGKEWRHLDCEADFDKNFHKMQRAFRRAFKNAKKLAASQRKRKKHVSSKDPKSDGSNRKS